MLVGHFAWTTGAAFAGAAFYISVADHPPRSLLDGGALLTQWEPNDRCDTMQARLAETLRPVAITRTASYAGLA